MDDDTLAPAAAYNGALLGTIAAACGTPGGDPDAESDLAAILDISQKGWRLSFDPAASRTLVEAPDGPAARLLAPAAALWVEVGATPQHRVGFCWVTWTGYGRYGQLWTVRSAPALDGLHVSRWVCDLRGAAGCCLAICARDRERDILRLAGRGLNRPAIQAALDLETAVHATMFERILHHLGSGQVVTVERRDPWKRWRPGDDLVCQPVRLVRALSQPPELEPVTGGSHG